MRVAPPFIFQELPQQAQFRSNSPETSIRSLNFSAEKPKASDLPSLPSETTDPRLSPRLSTGAKFFLVFLEKGAQKSSSRPGMRAQKILTVDSDLLSTLCLRKYVVFRT